MCPDTMMGWVTESFSTWTFSSGQCWVSQPLRNKVIVVGFHQRDKCPRDATKGRQDLFWFKMLEVAVLGLAGSSL